jgi:SAM-dependent methyltransferase
MTTSIDQPLATSLEPSAEVGFRPLNRFSWYRRAQAWMLARGNPAYEAQVRVHKSALFSSLRGNVVEIGPGGGMNFGFLHPDVRWIGIEPNPFFHPHLYEVATRLGRQIDVRAGSAERLPIADGYADAFVSSLVLCSVRDLDRSLAEIRRVLRPGGRFVFVEHVAAPRGTRLRLAQRILRPLWSAMGDGCHPDRDTASALQRAGFSRVEVERFHVPIPIMGPHIAGTAVN